MAFRGYPSRMTVEPTTRCNIHCVQCARNIDLRKKSDMSASTFKELLPVMEKLPAQFGSRVILNGNGESLLHKDFLWMLGKAKEAAPSVGFSTNGTLVDEKTARAFVELQLDEIYFSVDAVSPQLFNKIRKGADFNQVMAAVSLIAKYKRELKSSKPLLGFLFVAMEMNIAELPKLVKLASSLGVEKVKVTDLKEYPKTRGQSLVGRYNSFLPFLDEARKVAKAREIDLILPFEDATKSLRRALFLVKSEKAGSIKKALNFIKDKLLSKPGERVSVRDCDDPWKFVFVRHNGNVIPCCAMEEVMGNINEQSFEEIWFGKKYEALRARVASNNPPKECIKCLDKK